MSLLYGVIGAILFTLGGQIFLNVYYRYFDNTQYYTVLQPVSVDKKFYKPCESTILTAKRTSYLDMIGNFFIDLTLVRSDGAKYKVNGGHLDKQYSIQTGKDIIVSADFELPCDISDGLYFWQVTVPYKIHGFDRSYTFITETFNVTKTGVD